MVKAMAMVEMGVLIRHASEMFDVPKSSLYDRVSGRVQHGSQQGKAPYLNRQEEEELVKFLVKCAGITISTHSFIDIKQQINFKGLDRIVASAWTDFIRA